MEQAQIIAQLTACNALLQGHFILSSGLRSSHYVQCAQLFKQPSVAATLCAALADKAKGASLPAANIIVAPAMGGVIVGYEMSRQMGLPNMFCERVDGSFTLRRGFELSATDKVIIVEDVVTTGKSSLEAMKCVQSYGAEVVAELCLIDRSAGKANLPVPLISLVELNIPTHSPDALPPELAAIPAIKPGSRGLK